MSMTSRTIVGAICGGGCGLIFGALPAFGIVFGVLEDLIAGPSERTWFGAVWAAIVVLMVQLGALTGYLLGRVDPTVDKGLRGL
jgi:hypothetical protein